MKSLHRLGRALLVTCFLVAGAATAQAYNIDNIATLDYTYSGVGFTMNSNPATVLVSPPSSSATIEFLRTVDDPLGTTLPVTEFSSAAPPGTFNPILQPNPGTLTAATSYLNNDVVVIRVTDPDQNIDTTTAETVLVQVSGTVSGDLELLRLAETGLNTGIYIGYVYLSPLPPVDFDGQLLVTTDELIQADYIDPVNGDSASATSLVDPYGFIFDSATGLPVDGAEVVLIDEATGLDATTVLGDDGSAYPGRVVSGSIVTAGSLTYNFPPGGFRFPLIPAGDYRLQVIPPTGYIFPSAAASPAGAYTVQTPDSYGGIITVSTGVPIRVDVPLDPGTTGSSSGLWLQMGTDRNLVSSGDIFTFTLNVENTAAVTATTVSITQQLPAGFRYQPGSTTVDGIPAADPAVSADGSTLVFSIGDIPTGTTVDIDFRSQVGAILPGEYPSDALARAVSGQVSNPADATVRVRDELGNGKNIIAGRVLNGCGTEAGVEGVRIYLEDGTYVLTDNRGRYHIEGVIPGTHVVQIDPITLPEGYEAVSCEEHTRFADNPESRFVDLQPGSLWRADFYIHDKPINGEVSIALNNDYAIGSAATYTVTLAGNDIPFRNQTLEVELPPEATYLPGSSRLNDLTLTDPEIDGQKLTYVLPDQADTWQSTVIFQTFIDQETSTGEMPAHARLHFDTPASQGLVTPDAESTLIWISRGERATIKELLIRPHFGTLNAVLSPDDIASVDQAAKKIEKLNIIKVFVVGHTDERRISWREGILYRDNFELSEARAESVSRRLQEQLNLDPEQLVIVGMGAAEPMADNETEEGMALNRRTELRILHRIIIDPENEKIEAQSGKAGSLKTALESRNPENDPEPVATGILSPAAGQNLPHRIDAIRVRIDSKLKPKLSVDGTEIPEERVGFRMTEPDSETILMTYIGIDFGEPGQHNLKIEGIGPFGNTRFEQEITINRTGKIARLEVIDTEGNIADGRTPVKIQVATYDESGQRIPAGAKLEVRNGELIPAEIKNRRLPNAPDANLLTVNSSGTATFDPVNKAGLYHIVLGYEDSEVEADVYIAPEKRDWILVGLGEGTAGYNSISGNIQPLDPNAPEEDYYDDGRIAFFAKGQIRGEWLLTLAYDSDKEDLKDRSLQQIIDPGTYYTVYGDTSEQGYAAASAEKLFIRIERERFYTMFGDINTGMNVTDLSRYNRSLTGLKSEWSGKHFGYSAFASETAQGFVRDEIRGDGTSGLYRLSQSDIVINSEKIVLETRDRFHSEQILESRSLQRHLDYDIDYFAGTIFFKQPIQSRDQGLNPIFITVDYETGAQGAEDYTYGGRAYSRTGNGNVEIGASLVHEGQNAVASDLYGVDAKLKLTDSLTVSGEWATTGTTTPLLDTEGDAWLAEIEHRTRLFDLSAYMREQDAGFGLGQQNASESGTRKFGTNLRYRFSQRLDVDAEFYQQENLTSAIKRTVEEAALNYHDKRYNLSAGLRHAEDDQPTGLTETSDQITFAADYHVTKKLDLTLRHEQSIANNENRDYPTRTAVGANYKLNRSVSLFAEQEITAGDAADTASTRVGLNATPWDGGQIRTSMEQNLNEAGRRVFGNLGLLQTWQINPKLSLNFSVDRSQLISGTNNSSFHPDQPPASGSSEDFTALSTGLSYREIDWTFDTRVEYRTSDTEERWGLFAGSIVEPETFLGLSLHGSYFTTDRSDQSTSTDADLSFGLAYRPDNRVWLILNRLDLATSLNETTTAKTAHWKIVERLNAFWRANANNRLNFKAGVRYAADDFGTIDYSGMTWLFGSEWRHDISNRIDVGLHGSALTVQELGQSLYHSGASIGYSPAENFWISLGYNYQGFQDDDFSQAEYTAQGPYVKFRMKFDQNSVRDALRWMGRN